MHLLPILLCTVITLAVGYGDGNYGPDGGGYYDYEDHKNECKKLKHFDFEPINIAHFNREAKFSHVEKHGKDYIMISCPIDSQKYALIAEQEGTTSKISTSDYSDTVILADGSHVSVLAKCDGKRFVAKTADGDEIRIKKVACIQYPEAVPWFCSSCNTDSITLTKGNDIEALIIQLVFTFLDLTGIR
ncbi:hypothetical protein CAEBREN_14260 [Caenorhabditis brenneri]|uniref:Uncharacterized protein n=1 Tax=Caenorhabditis brenneri TaxID=135651 RepID=G0P391_CAEBE|nr:hypothetical protein CAEBREN_14260 [Caenorhabditis brenneri]